MERVLTFKYAFERENEKDKLKHILEENNIEYICYESSGYYPHEFIIRKKSGFRWNDIMELINSVLATRYSYKKTELEYVDGKLTEICRIGI